jgi:hypothetical protein
VATIRAITPYFSRPQLENGAKNRCPACCGGKHRWVTVFHNAASPTRAAGGCAAYPAEWPYRSTSKGGGGGYRAYRHHGWTMFQPRREQWTRKRRRQQPHRGEKPTPLREPGRPTTPDRPASCRNIHFCCSGISWRPRRPCAEKSPPAGVGAGGRGKGQVRKRENPLMVYLPRLIRPPLPSAATACSHP